MHILLKKIFFKKKNKQIISKKYMNLFYMNSLHIKRKSILSKFKSNESIGSLVFVWLGRRTIMNPYICSPIHSWARASPRAHC